MTTKVGFREDSSVRPRPWHAALWRTWMLARAAGRGLGLAVKLGYLSLAFAVIGALGVGFLTITIGGLIADILTGTGLAPEGASSSAVATVATITLCLGSLVAAALTHPASPHWHPIDAVRETATRGLQAVRSFRAEWSEAGEVWTKRARRRDRRHRARVSAVPRRTADGRIIGHRIWVVGPGHESGASLIAPVSRLHWERSAMAASCDAHLARKLTGSRYVGHEAPAPVLECVCGVYALKRSTWPTPRHRAPLAAGSVELTGRVIEASRGYRAEHAEITGTVRIDLVCAGEIGGELWTTQADGNWQPVPPNPCPFDPVTLAAGVDEYIGLCRIHAARVAHLLESTPQLTPLALQAQLELRYGVDVIIRGRAAQWT